MAENDAAVFNAAVGYVYTNVVGSAAPAPGDLQDLDLEDPDSWAVKGWVSVGHTSRGKLPEFGFDGGKEEIKGSWQKKRLREIVSEDPIDHLTVVLHQFDEDALSLYYGKNVSDVDGTFGVATGQTNEKALFVVIVDADVRLGHHALKTSVKRDEAIDLPIDDFAALPVKFTYLDYEGSKALFCWISPDLFSPAAPVVPDPVAVPVADLKGDLKKPEAAVPAPGEAEPVSPAVEPVADLKGDAPKVAAKAPKPAAVDAPVADKAVS